MADGTAISLNADTTTFAAVAPRKKDVDATSSQYVFEIEAQASDGMLAKDGLPVSETLTLTL